MGRVANQKVMRTQLKTLDLFIFANDFFLNLFLSALGLRCCAQAFSSRGEQGLLFVAACRLLIVVSSLLAEHGL